MTEGTDFKMADQGKGAVNGHKGSVFFHVNLFIIQSTKFEFDLFRIH